MRSLEMTDVFKASRLLIKIGVREEIREVALRAEESKGKKIKIDFGFDLLFGVFEKATQEKAEEDIYKFIADLFECDPEEVRHMSPIKVFEGLEKVANIEEWKSFFVYVRTMIMKK